MIRGKTLFAIFSILIVSGAVVAFAVTTQIWSNPVTETVTTIQLTLSSNNTTPVLNQTVQFSALLTANGAPYASKTIDFYKDSMFNGSSTTDGSGIASYLWTADSNCTWKAAYTVP